MVAMDMVSAGGFPGVSFHLRKCPQWVASVLRKKNPHFWVPTIKVRPPDGNSCCQEHKRCLKPKTGYNTKLWIPVVRNHLVGAIGSRL